MQVLSNLAYLCDPQDRGCLLELVLTPKSRKRGNSTFSTNSHEGIPEERSSSINSRILLENLAQDFPAGGPQYTDRCPSDVKVSEHHNQNTTYYDDAGTFGNHSAGFGSSSIDHSFLNGFKQAVFDTDTYGNAGVGPAHNAQLSRPAAFQTDHRRNDQIRGSGGGVFDQSDLSGGGVGVEHEGQFRGGECF